MKIKNIKNIILCLIILILLIIILIILLPNRELFINNDNSNDYPNNEQFDIVITWVDWSNKNFVDKLKEAGGRSEETDSGDYLELKYNIRSLQEVPYRNIYIVHSDNHPPPTYLREGPNLFFIKHSQMVKDNSYLPLIHRESILANLHNIPGLLRYYFYIEDDTFTNNTNIYKEILNDYINNKTIISPGFQYLFLKPPFDVTKSCGLWYKSTVNSRNLIINKNDNTYLGHEHSIILMDKNIINKLEKIYSKNFKMTQSYKNQKLEKDKEPYLISIVTLFVNYLIYKENYKYFEKMTKKIFQLHTNGYSNNQSEENINKLKQDLEKSKQYYVFNAQGDGISDEYPKADKVHKIFYDWVEKNYPNKSIYE